MAPFKWLSRWIKVDKWDYFYFLSQIFFSISYFTLIQFFFKYETIVRRSASSFGHSDPDPSSALLWRITIVMQCKMRLKSMNENSTNCDSKWLVKIHLHNNLTFPGVKFYIILERRYNILSWFICCQINFELWKAK